jgi:hypothetical protein
VRVQGDENLWWSPAVFKEWTQHHSVLGYMAVVGMGGSLGGDEPHVPQDYGAPRLGVLTLP